jgi:hypothetical protein
MAQRLPEAQLSGFPHLPQSRPPTQMAVTDKKNRTLRERIRHA